MKFEDLEGIKYPKNKHRVKDYIIYRKLVNSLLVTMDNIAHKVASEIDPDGRLMMDLEDYCNSSFYHRFPSSCLWDLDDPNDIDEVRCLKEGESIPDEFYE